MVKIAIFGGTGMTGVCTVQHALNKGLTVNLLYRDAKTIPDSFKDNVNLIKGNVINLDDVKRTITGTDRVCVVLGTRNKLDPTTEMSTGLTNIITAMKDLGVRKISVCLSSFLFYEPDKVPAMFEHVNKEHQTMLDLIKSSGLDYVAILPPHIADEPSSDYEVLHDKSPGRVISKYDLAMFLIDSLDQAEHTGRVCGLAKKV